MRAKRPWPLAFFVLFLFLLAVVSKYFPHRVLAQSGCPTYSQLGPTFDWPNCGAGCKVPVSVAINTTWTNSLGGTGTLSATQVQYITAGVIGWSGQNGVTFTVTSGPGMQPSSSAPFTLGINVGPTDSSETVGQETPGQPGNGCGGNCVRSASITLQYNQGTLFNNALLQAVVAHEMGHTFGIADLTPCSSNSDMSAAASCLTNGGPTACDKAVAAQIGTKYTSANPPPGGSGSGTGGCAPTGTPPYIPPDTGAEYVWSTSSCSWVLESCAQAGCSSPIIIDTDGAGFHLTSAKNGILFDFFGSGQPIQIAWTGRASTNGWLALDRNGNGTIDSARELFGNITAQPDSPAPNGFLALGVFDLPQYGGNSDGMIDSRDAVWDNLVVWIDSNHDGVSQPDELYRPDDLGIHSISLTYVETRRIDAYGNEFRYKGSLNWNTGNNVDRAIYDVFLKSGASQ